MGVIEDIVLNGPPEARWRTEVIDGLEKAKTQSMTTHHLSVRVKNLNSEDKNIWFYRIYKMVTQR